MKNLNFLTAKGSEIESIIPDLGKLRIKVFYEFPYLYAGTEESEKEYLQVYLNCPESFVFAVYDGPLMVGATTAIPLSYETEEVKNPFLRSPYSIEKVFYFGESILLPEYRGLGLGHRFFDEREKYALSFGKYTVTAFCAVDRPDNHPLKPDNYRTNEHLWRKRGYTIHPELSCTMSWLDINEKAETSKKLTFWLKEHTNL